jgi:hypothetical protein
MKKPKTVVQGHSKNLDTLIRAASNGHLALVECEIKGLPFTPGEKVAVVCAVRRDKDGMFDMTPFCVFFNGSPYDFLIPPDPGQETEKS